MTEVAALYEEIDALISAVRREGNAQAAAQADHIVRSGFGRNGQNSIRSFSATASTV